MEKTTKDKTIKSNPDFITVEAKTFGTSKIGSQMLSQIIISLQSNKRAVGAHVKTRGEVAGTTRKPWRQKGTGRARVGNRRNPVWRGGGVVFGPSKERNFNKKINKQLSISTLKRLLISKAEAGQVIKIENIAKDIKKTKDLITILSPALVPRSNLLVVKEKNSNLNKVINNIEYLNLITADRLGVIETVLAHRLIFTTDALTAIKERIK